MKALQAKEIAKQFSRELGFVNLAALESAASKQELEVFPGVGFCNYHHRKDGQTTIYELAVNQKHQRQGWGRLLFYRVMCGAIENKSDRIVAKCPEDLTSNGFYQRLGFELIGTESGRVRRLNKWQYTIQLPLLFYCGSGGKSKYDAIASEKGWRLGVRSCGKWKIHQHMQMVDNEWKEYSHERHLKIVKENKPLICTARDIESPDQLPEILEQAKELAQHTGRVLLIPKCFVELPPNQWLGFSVPSAYGGVPPKQMQYWLSAGKYAGASDPAWYQKHFVHLLGGSPESQAQYARLLNVVSLDANYAMNVARFGKSCWQGCSGGKKFVEGNYNALALSLEKQKSYWHRQWSWSDEPLSSLLNL